MAGLYSHTTRATGTVLTAAIYNEDHQNHIDNLVPDQIDDYSSDVTEMQSATSPGTVGAESQPTTLAGELERIRYMLKYLGGGAQWYSPQKMPTVQTFTADGTWTKPTGLKWAIIKLVAGGGGGGGVGSGANPVGAGGGAGGGACWKIVAAADLGATEDVTVGAGGTAGANTGGTGGTGGTSSFGAHCSATGGAGGVGADGSAAQACSGGSGGVGSSGSENASGSGGGAGFPDSNDPISGAGGASGFGMGGGAPGIAANVGATGGSYGGGGSGACGGGSTARSGGAGGPGVVQVWEFY